ncbi:DNA-binding protein [Massilia eurypsychrophila]|uniref:DNA-binding protein n=1 Tax=Massilia eurypsychrophila TaxID=1485217 RepID=A0A2G8THT9_9BURK|nr:nucleotide-binding protein [Massilia eurypsychrophila]PIL45509.1 DNA-binding protein [Massilia eurypsychrophila]
MSDLSVAMAKLSGIRKSVITSLTEMSLNSPKFRFDPAHVGQYFTQAAGMVKVLQREMPELFDDFAAFSTEPAAQTGTPPKDYFSRSQLERLVRDIDHIFELRANSPDTQPIAKQAAPLSRVFITHGRSPDWREVQAYIEKDLRLSTLELAQEISLGMTVIEKLEAGGDRCDSAVIVMTGEDIDADGQARARENVMHEIGFFQGRYGRSKVILLHEDGVSIPSNLSGVVYLPYPKGAVSASFHVLSRELKALHGL